MKRLIILSGAGLSAESGIQTFRGNDGLWDDYELDVVCNFYTWKKNYHIVHQFYSDRRVSLKDKQPNLMHKMIAKWQKQLKDNCLIFTQNIDDLLERADCENIIHLHGEIKKMVCTECNYVVDLNYNKTTKYNCKKCNSKWIKPYVVFFNEAAPYYQVLYTVFNSITNLDMVIIIGTSGLVINVDYLVSNLNSVNILNNLNFQTSINETNFDHIFYEKATTAASKIDLLVQKHFDLK